MFAVRNAENPAGCVNHSDGDGRLNAPPLKGIEMANCLMKYERELIVIVVE